MAEKSSSLSFARSLKTPALEEFLDFYFYRRVAFLLVPGFLKLGLSPNQVTTLSLLTGLAAGYAVFKSHFYMGAALAVGAICLDCCDGQIARLTGKTSPLGRMMDGVFDLIWIATLWLAIYFSGVFHNLTLMIPASLSMILHCWRFDGIRVRYLKLTDPSSGEKDLDATEAMTLCKAEASRLNILAAFLALMIALHFKIFVPRKKNAELPLSQTTRAKIRGILEPALRLWPWLGEGHHNTLVILGLLVAPLSPNGLAAAFLVILIPMNAWWFYCERIWRSRMREAVAVMQPTSTQLAASS